MSEFVTATSPSPFLHECSFRTRATAESVYDYFMDFPRHADWEERVEKIIEWGALSVTVRCEAPRSGSRAARVKWIRSGLDRRKWTIVADNRPTSVTVSVSWEGEQCMIGGMVERLTLATDSFGTQVSLSEDISAMVPVFARR